jgi:hypothetical protein
MAHDSSMTDVTLLTDVLPTAPASTAQLLSTEQKKKRTSLLACWSLNSRKLTRGKARADFAKKIRIPKTRKKTR